MDFGNHVNAWWSRKWLDTLLESADEQTVLQGMRFVERGQVTSIDIIDNRVISVVKGPNGYARSQQRRQVRVPQSSHLKAWR